MNAGCMSHWWQYACRRFGGYLKCNSVVLATLAAALVCWAAVSAQQTSRSDSARIEGRVVDGESGRPIGGVSVFLAKEGQTPNRSVISGTDGKFVVVDLPAGDYFLFLSKAGFASGMYGEKEPAGYGELLHVLAGDTVSGLTATLWKRPVIAGSVVDEAGRAILGAKVEFLSSRWLAGLRVYKVSSTALTDEHGEFRYIASAGRYLVRAPVVSSTKAKAFMAFFPQSTSLDQAESVVVSLGKDRSGLAFRMVGQAAGRIVGGTISAPGGFRGRLIEATLRVRGSVDTRADVEIARTQIRSDGRFEFPSVPSGEYVLRVLSLPEVSAVPREGVRANIAVQGSSGAALATWSDQPLTPLPDGPTLWIEEPVDVGDRDLRLSLQLSEGLSVSGRVSFVGTEPPPSAASLPSRCVSVVPADGRELGLYPCGRIESDGSFRTMAVPAGRYVIDVPQGFGAWRLVSVESNGDELAGRAFDLSSSVGSVRLVFSQQRTSISGTVVDRNGQPVSNAFVLAIDAEHARSRADGLGVRSRLVTSRTDAAGRFETELFAGVYSLAAIAGKVPEDWQASDSIEGLSRSGKRVVVAGGQRNTVELRAQIR